MVPYDHPLTRENVHQAIELRAWLDRNVSIVFHELRRAEKQPGESMLGWSYTYSYGDSQRDEDTDEDEEVVTVHGKFREKNEWKVSKEETFYFPLKWLWMTQKDRQDAINRRVGSDQEERLRREKDRARDELRRAQDRVREAEQRVKYLDDPAALKRM